MNITLALLIVPFVILKIIIFINSRDIDGNAVPHQPTGGETVSAEGKREREAMRVLMFSVISHLVLYVPHFYSIFLLSPAVKCTPLKKCHVITCRNETYFHRVFSP